MMGKAGPGGGLCACLISVGDYRGAGLADLPSWKKDLDLIRDGLLRGLRIPSDRVRTVGEAGTVLRAHVAAAMAATRESLGSEDVLFLYFSGHCDAEALWMSDGRIRLESVVDFVGGMGHRATVLVLDCCHAGAVEPGEVPVLLSEETIASFAGCGTAVMASASAGEAARLGLPPDHSLYTAMLSAAMRMRHPVRRGCISLQDLAAEVSALVRDWNSCHPERRQTPVFHAAMGGTIFFPVGEVPAPRVYVPVDRGDYLIYDERPLHTGRERRAAVFLQTGLEEAEELARAAREVAKAHPGMAVVWCYFGHDAADMLRHVFFARAVWAADEAHRRMHFRGGADARVLGDAADRVCVIRNASYGLVRRLQASDITEEYAGRQSALCARVVNGAEAAIAVLREVENRMDASRRISGALLLEAEGRLAPALREIRAACYLLSELPPAPIRSQVGVAELDREAVLLHARSEELQDLAGWALDIEIYAAELIHSQFCDDRAWWLSWNAVRHYYETLDLMAGRFT